MTVTVHWPDIPANPEANSWDFFLAPHLPPCGLLLKAPSHHPWLFFHTLFSGPYQHFHHFRNACLSLIFHHTSPVEINEWWVWNSSPFMTKVIIVGPGESDLLTGRWRKLPVPPALWGGMVSRGILSISWELRASVYSWEQGLEPTALFLSPVSSTQILGPYRGAGPRDIESRVVPTSNGRGTQERRSTQVSTWWRLKRESESADTTAWTNLNTLRPWSHE